MSARDEVLHPFRSAISDLARWIAEKQLEATLIGGLAVGLRSRPRLTQDIDALLWSEEPPDGKLLDSAATFGFVPRVSDVLEFVRSHHVLMLQHAPSGVRVDISAAFLPFEREVIERSELVRISQDAVLPVATAEDLLIMKVIAGRPRDWIDVEQLIEINPNIDRDRAERWCRDYCELLGFPERMDRLRVLLGS